MPNLIEGEEEVEASCRQSSNKMRIHRMEIISFLVLAVAALATRLLPLSSSPYPFNNDSLTECTIASQILETGRLDTLYGLHSSIPSHSLSIPALNVLIAQVASLLGVEPLQCAQLVGAVISVFTVTGIYVFAKLATGSHQGALMASLGALMLGTFVFTTGSVWKEALGIPLLVMMIIAFIRRSEWRFRILCFALLVMLPLVHHLVAVIGLLIVAFPVIWGVYFGFTNRTLGRRHLLDLATVSIPSVWTVLYYYTVSLDRLETFSSITQMALIVVAFALLAAAAVTVLSLKKHVRWTFAPLLGIAIVTILVLDRTGLFFDYKSSTPMIYMVYVFAFAALFSIAWFGAEVSLEKGSNCRAIVIGLLFAPVTIIGYGLLGGFTYSSHQIIYRTFDFADIFIFIGIGTAIAALHKRRGRAYPLVSIAVIVMLAVSFPFAYYTEQLTGVRHDTQGYEVDAMGWIAQFDDSEHFQVQSDERLSYMGSSMFGFPKDNALPTSLKDNISLAPDVYFIYEDFWSSRGVNNYPHGFVTLQPDFMNRLLNVENVLYLGGDRGDQLVVFSATAIGQCYSGWVPAP